LQYPTYLKWIDSTWITDIWKFIHQAKITVDVENQWLPRLCRQHDTAIMDFAITLSLNAFQLGCINTCRLFLQVTTLSDIVSANGEYIVPFILDGHRDECRGTDLLWPSIPCPPASFWRHWNQFLQHLTNGRRLIQPLGPWLNTPMNSWHWYTDSMDTLWHSDPITGTWTAYKTVLQVNRPRTRHTANVYTAFSTDTSPSPPLFPVTVSTNPDGTITAAPGIFQIDTAEPSHSANLWRHAIIPSALADTPPFFQHLISSPPSDDQCQEIAMELQENALAVCSDVACDSNLHIASFGAVLASSLLQQMITRTVGPVDGHLSLVTSYRAELSGIIACLYTIYRICQYYQISSGSCTLYCDNKCALCNAFRPIHPGITAYFKTDHDLVEIAQSLLTTLPITVTLTWVKGHYKGNKIEYQHLLNEKADQIAGEYQQIQHPHISIRCPPPPPNYKVCLLYDKSVLTAKAQSTISSAMHTAPIEEHSIRKAGWDRWVFNLVHWDAHEKSFKFLPCYSQHSTSKLLHGLLNTNHQNQLYYGASPLCPICQQVEETLPHVFLCPHPSAVAHRNLRLDKLYQNLEAASTPPLIIDSLRNGFQAWFSNRPPTSVRAPTAGSLSGPAAVLTSAFHEQYHNIGWYHLCLGQVSRKWSKTVLQYMLPDQHPYTELHWTSILISALWQLSRAVWKFCNETVHGATVEEQARRKITSLRHNTEAHFQAFSDNPNIVLPRYQYLFTSQLLEDWLSLLYDNLAAWNRSVTEALQVVRHHDEAMREVSQIFFPAHHLTSDASDSDSTYTPANQSSLDTLSFAPTTITEATTATLSSTSSTITYCRPILESSTSKDSSISSRYHGHTFLATPSAASSRSTVQYDIFPGATDTDSLSDTTIHTATSLEHSSSTNTLDTRHSSIPSSISWHTHKYIV